MLGFGVFGKFWNGEGPTEYLGSNLYNSCLQAGGTESFTVCMEGQSAKTTKAPQSCNEMRLRGTGSQGSTLKLLQPPAPSGAQAIITSGRSTVDLAELGIEQ